MGRSYGRPSSYNTISYNAGSNFGGSEGHRVGESRFTEDHKVTSEFAELQASEWRTINAELVKRLSSYVESPNQKKLVSDVSSLRDQLYSDYRLAEAELRSKQRDLVFASENSDFIKSAVLSRDLVTLKARMQATQAAHHELDACMRRSKVSASSCDHVQSAQQARERGSIELGAEQIIHPEPVREEGAGRLAKIIPLRKSGSY